ncbi:GerAB/ArcD/ProY family transporter [Bacillus cereus]|uniref:GerAB/ArcD/ProY family transporter n=1 Tax=Bacillus cereus TaxID=1396 RepID=UPI003980690C
MLRMSKTQLFALIVLFEIGSTPLFALGIEAKQDAWLAILIAMIFGFFLLWIYTEIQRHFPDKNLAEILTIILGKWLAGPLILLYALYFLFIASLNLREFGELIIMTLLPSTPMMVILMVFMLTIFYFLFLGQEVLSRTSEVMLPVVLFFIVLTYVLLIMTGEMDFTELEPILGDGWKPVLSAAFPTIVNFPFGEMVLFLMYWKFVNYIEKIRKISFFALGLSGLLLMTSLVMIVSRLGVEYASNQTLPLFEMIKLINIADFITNMDIIASIIIFIGGFYKMTLFFYGGVLSIKHLFKRKHEKWLIVLTGILLLWFTLVYFPNLPFHRWVGLKVVIPYVHVPFQIICPSLLLIIIKLKK